MCANIICSFLRILNVGLLTKQIINGYFDMMENINTRLKTDELV